jgi:hypothetical protein
MNKNQSIVKIHTLCTCCTNTKKYKQNNNNNKDVTCGTIL